MTKKEKVVEIDVEKPEVENKTDEKPEVEKTEIDVNVLLQTVTKALDISNKKTEELEKKLKPVKIQANVPSAFKKTAGTCNPKRGYFKLCVNCKRVFSDPDAMRKHTCK
jgi:hypothetical protein